MTIYAALFEAGTPVAFLSGSIRQMNANVSPTRTWRELSRDIRALEDVPPLESLPPHPELAGSD